MEGELAKGVTVAEFWLIVVAVAAALATVVTIGKHVGAIWGWIKGACRALQSAYRYLKNMLLSYQIQQEINKKLNHLVPAVEEIRSEMRINGGSSLKDLALQTKEYLAESRWIEYELADEARWETGKLANGRFGTVRVTSHLVRLVGLPESDIMGSGWESALHPDYRDAVVQQWDEAVEEVRPFQAKYAFLHTDGAVVYVQAIFRPYKGKKGEFLGGRGRLIEIAEDGIHTTFDR